MNAADGHNSGFPFSGGVATAIDGLITGSISRGYVGTAIVATRSGYTLNNASGAGPIRSGTSLGRNICNAALCP